MKKPVKKTSNLSNIADISMGYAFRGAVPYVESSDTSLLQLRDTPLSFLLRPDDFQPIKEGTVPLSQQLHEGDLVLRSKGNFHYTVLFRLQDFQAVVSQNYMIIRVTDAAVLPEYLLWFLNQRTAQKFLEKISAGTMVPQVTVRDLSFLPVTVPPISEQKAISQIFLLKEQERELSDKLAMSREKLINEKLLSVVEV